MKKFVLALLAVVLVLGLCTVAYADECNHNWVPQVDAPVCGATGSYYEYCTNCGATRNETQTAVKEHTVTAYVKATCTEDAYFYCPDCKQTIVEKGSKLGHDKVLRPQDDVPATCDKEGYELWTCRRPGCDWTELKVFPKLNHKDEAGKDLHTIVKHTYAVENCVEGGKYLMECEKCSDTIIKEVKPLGHAWTAWHIDEEATCTMDGFKSRTCTRKGCQDYRNGKPAEEGEVIPALGHDIVYTVTKKPTCTAEGEEFGTCGRCEKTFTRAIPMIDHDWTEWTVVGDCKVRTCKVCHKIENCTGECPADPETPVVPDKPATGGNENTGNGGSSSTGSGSDASIPATGDNTSNVPYIMMVAAVAGLVVLVASKRKVNC